MDFDLFVIGGGSAGVRCARISAGHGARVGIAEERHWGGTCVNIGCVPKKLLVQAGEYGGWAEDAAGFGWSIQKGPHDAMSDGKHTVVCGVDGSPRRAGGQVGAPILPASVHLVGLRPCLLSRRRYLHADVLQCSSDLRTADSRRILPWCLHDGALNSHS